MKVLYLLKISAMYKNDEADIVPSAEFVCDEDFSTVELPILDALHKLQNDFTTMVMGLPGSQVRAMTRTEIDVWREEQHQEEECGFEVVEV